MNLGSSNSAAGGGRNGIDMNNVVDMRSFFSLGVDGEELMRMRLDNPAQYKQVLNSAATARDPNGIIGQQSVRISEKRNMMKGYLDLLKRNIQNVETVMKYLDWMEEDIGAAKDIVARKTITPESVKAIIDDMGSLIFSSSASSILQTKLEIPDIETLFRYSQRGVLISLLTKMNEKAFWMNDTYKTTMDIISNRRLFHRMKTDYIYHDKQLTLESAQWLVAFMLFPFSQLECSIPPGGKFHYRLRVRDKATGQMSSPPCWTGDEPPATPMVKKRTQSGLDSATPTPKRLKPNVAGAAAARAVASPNVLFGGNAANDYAKSSAAKANKQKRVCLNHFAFAETSPFSAQQQCPEPASGEDEQPSDG